MKLPRFTIRDLFHPWKYLKGLLEKRAAEHREQERLRILSFHPFRAPCSNCKKIIPTWAKKCPYCHCEMINIDLTAM